MKFSSHNMRYHYLLSVSEAKSLGVLRPIVGWFEALGDYTSTPYLYVPPRPQPYPHQKQLEKATIAVVTSLVCSLLGTPRAHSGLCQFLSQCVEKWYLALGVFSHVVPSSRSPMAGTSWANPRERLTRGHLRSTAALGAGNFFLHFTTLAPHTLSVCGR